MSWKFQTENFSKNIGFSISHENPQQATHLFFRRMPYTLPFGFIPEFSDFVANSLNLDASLSKKLKMLVKEFIHGDAAPYAIKIARNSSSLSENSGKIVVVVPAKGPVFVAQNDVNLKNLKDVVKSVSNGARVTEKINATYGAGYNVAAGTDKDKFVEDIQVALNEKNHECTVIRLVARPDTAYIAFLKEASKKYPSNSISANARLWAAHKEKIAAGNAASSEPTQTFPEPAPTLVIADPDATLVIPEPEPKKKVVVRRK